MLYFKTRDQARAFANKTNRTMTDLGADAPKRWAVQIVTFEGMSEL